MGGNGRKEEREARQGERKTGSNYIEKKYLRPMSWGWAAVARRDWKRSWGKIVG